ncbi:MAG: hypothetical protein KIT09_05530 [Bryobacteraceae bacterium]|nr:hypothetical protein [Bryobacteraceae bacterium]
MKLAAIPALVLAGLAAACLLRAHLGGRLPVMEAPIVIAAAFNVYFYSGYLAALLFGAAPGKRLAAALGVPAVVFLALVVVDLFSGPPSGGWINLRLRFRDFWALPGVPVYSLLSKTAGAAKMRAPLGQMRAMNIDVDLLAAIARPDGGPRGRRPVRRGAEDGLRNRASYGRGGPD